MNLQLVSYVTCPFVQRAELVLRYKGVAHETTYVDLKNKPAWFLAQSPRGKVPLLIADGTVLFESQAICEFLEETHPTPPLFSGSAIERARDRAWFAVASEDVFLPLREIRIAVEEAPFRAARSKLEATLSRVQEELGTRLWLSGDGSRFGMAEVAFAPAFTRLELLEQMGAFRLPSHLDKLRAFCQRTLDVPAVRGSVAATFEEKTVREMRERGAFCLAGLPDAPSASRGG